MIKRMKGGARISVMDRAILRKNVHFETKVLGRKRKHRLTPKKPGEKGEGPIGLYGLHSLL